MNTLVLLMAQGDGGRWLDRTPKHLARFNDEPILTRTCRQMEALWPDAEKLVIGWHYYYPFCKPTPLLTLPEPGPDLCHGIYNSRFLWQKERIIILLGDVAYSWALLERIRDDRAQLRVYGRLQPHPLTGKKCDERYAIAFTRLLAGVVEQAAQEVIADEECIPALKSLYHTLIGAPRHYADRPSLVCWEDQILAQVDDYTDDFDQYQEYKRAKAAIEAAIRKEEQNGRKEESCEKTLSGVRRDPLSGPPTRRNHQRQI